MHDNIPHPLANHDDPISASLTFSPLLEGLDASNQLKEHQLYTRRLAHYHYAKHTSELNPPNFAHLTDPLNRLRRRLVQFASEP